MSCFSNTCAQTSSSRRVSISDAVLLADLMAVSRRLGKEKISVNDYQTFGRYCFRTHMRRFDSWTQALAKAGLRPAHRRHVSAKALLRDLQRVARRIKSPKLTAKRYRAMGRYDIKTAYRHFGKWQHALAAAGLIPGCHRPPETQRARGPRIVNATLRFRVMQRDNFRCVMCGLSPANELGVKLQVDHIVPWSKGGATVLENLQTLCRVCNQGKCDLDFRDGREKSNSAEAELV
jgi:HNH endonuclease/Homing endonuclease associated repeat